MGKAVPKEVTKVVPNEVQTVLFPDIGKMFPSELRDLISPPKPKMPEFSMEPLAPMVLPELSIPDVPQQAIPEAAKQGAFDVQKLKKKGGSTRDLRREGSASAGYVSAIRSAASRAGLNLPV